MTRIIRGGLMPLYEGADETPAPSFYGRTWHDTRENALKCPPCKEVVLAEERRAAPRVDPSGRHTYQPSPSNRCAYRYPAGIGCGHPEKHELHLAPVPNPVQWQVEQQNQAIKSGLKDIISDLGTVLARHSSGRGF